MKRKVRSFFHPLNIIINLFLLTMSLVSIVPFVYMAFTSLRQVYSLLDFSFSLSELNFENYKAVFTNFPFMLYFRNSCICVITSCTLNVLVASMAGYGFAKKKFKGRDAIFFLFLATMMIPGQVTMIPIYMIFTKLKLLNTYVALVLPSVGVFGVFLMRQFMSGLPDELIEAAQIDGCSEFRLFTRIILPLVKPVIISLTIFTFISMWNDFVWPLIVVTDEAHTTLTLGLSTLSGLYKTNYGLVMAGSTLTFLTPFILYIFLQKQFVEGIVMTGIKG